MENFIKEYYDTRDENSRFESLSGKVEFITTMKYISKYLKPGMKILDVGAGTGRYSLALANLGYSVDAVELVESNINVFKSLQKNEQEVNIVQGNATNLSMYNDSQFDATLVLGPLYHLISEIDKKKAIEEAIRVTKPQGIIFVAYCISDATLLISGFKKKKFNIDNHIKVGKINPETFKTKSEPDDIFELVRKEDIDRLMLNFNTTRLHYLGTDMYTHYMPESINDMDKDTFELYMKYHLSICERSDMLGITNHSLDVFRKES